MSLLQKLENADTILISGHIRPDGDCAGSCLGLWNYVKANYPEKSVQVCLEPLPGNLLFLPGAEEIITPEQFQSNYDLFVSLDASTLDRLGACSEWISKASDNIVIDHHETNVGFGKENIIRGEVSSASEVLYELLDPDRMNLNTALCLYTGIIHDTGVFKYPATSERTMQIAGHLMSFGIPTAKVIDESFYEKTWLQTKLCAYATSNAELVNDGKIAYTVLTMDDMASFHATSADTEGVINRLRLVKGVEVAIFAREDAPNTFKFSLRAKEYVDVARIANELGGGGHRFAAGVTLEGEWNTLLSMILDKISEQM